MILLKNASTSHSFTHQLLIQIKLPHGTKHTINDAYAYENLQYIKIISTQLDDIKKSPSDEEKKLNKRKCLFQ